MVKECVVFTEMGSTAGCLLSSLLLGAVRGHVVNAEEEGKDKQKLQKKVKLPLFAHEPHLGSKFQGFHRKFLGL